jgi:glycosyltransferase involved in cell wall biosynthesis
MPENSLSSEAMSVGLDVSPLAQTRAGTARYVSSLLAALEAEGGVELRRYGWGGNGRLTAAARDTGWYLAALPARARRDAVDVLHCPTFRAPVRSSVPLVVTVHDLAVLRHPATFNRWTRAYSSAILPRVARAADAIVAVSEFTRGEVVDLLGVPPERVSVISHGVAPAFAAEGPVAEGDYVLAVSTLEPRKNLPRLLEAFRLADLDGCELRVVGARGWGGVRVAGERVRWLGEVGDQELARLYRGARCVAYPSLYEGFGLPVLEAMACGAAVVTSTAPAVREVADGAAVAVDGLEASAIAAGLEEAIARRDELGRNGVERAAKFTWREAARRTVAVYRTAVGEP